MSKIFKKVLEAAIALVILFFAYKLIFIRIVNYEIAGVAIPSEYNVLTGKVTPILDYEGRKKLPEMYPRNKGNLGLSEEQAIIAKFRWAVFEQWVSLRPEYKDWETNAETFKKAHDEFRDLLKKFGAKVTLIK